MLNAIFNGVAMICQQTAFIWGFALFASFWRIASTVFVATVETSSGKAGAVLHRGSYSAVMPLIFAMLLTVPALQKTVQVESTLNGNVTTIDNVPMAIAVIPVGGSLMSTNVGGTVTTAFQAVGTNYPAISAQANGFINPLKILLSARTAVLRLGSVDSQVKTLVSSCLASDAGVDYAAVSAAVVNAGNTGATSAQTIAINGVAGTALGALLFQAAQNATGLVPNLAPNGASVLSCSDAANLVAANITAAMNSREFGRVVQGAVNGMDDPVPTADYSIDNLTTQYTAIATANRVTNTLQGGATQAQQEMYNLLFAEMVNGDLNCLAANSSDKTNCQASMVQAAEIERHNLSSAANIAPMLRYAGNFANYLMALIIGLGPVIVMFMMFAGVDSGKSVKTALHIMVWPLLVSNVAAELVNGMIDIQFANFMTSIRQGGMLTQAEAITIYKELSMQIGVGSQIMASLPVLMSMIFALGESAALVSMARAVSPAVNEAGPGAAPKAIDSPSLVSSSAPYAGTSEAGGTSVVKARGALDAVSSSMQFGNVTQEFSNTLSEADTRQQTISQGQQNLADWKGAFSSGDYSKVGVDHRTGDTIREAYESNLRAGARTTVGEGQAGARLNANSASAGVAGGLKVGSGGITGSIGASGDTKTAAQDSLEAKKQSARERSIDESKALVKAVANEIGDSKTVSSGHDTNRALSKTVDTQSSFQKLLSSSQTSTNTTAEALKQSNNFLSGVQKIGPQEIAWQMGTNSDYSRFQLLQGRTFDETPSAQRYLAEAQQEMQNGGIDQVSGNPSARSAVLRTRAATMMAGDQSATPEDRMMALRFLASGAQEMTHVGMKPLNDEKMHGFNIAAPQDTTGVNPVAVRGAVERHVPGQGIVAPATTAPVPGQTPGNHPRTAARPAAALRPVGGSAPGAVATSPSKADALREEIKGSVAQGAAAVKEEEKRQAAVAQEAGLKADGHGTVVRVAANVVDNAASVVRPTGQADRTHLGEGKK